MRTSKAFRKLFAGEKVKRPRVLLLCGWLIHVRRAILTFVCLDLTYIYLVFGPSVALGAPSEFEYKLRGHRYEGQIEIPVRAKPFKALSFIRTREPFSQDAGIKLRIRFFLPISSWVDITAAEIVVRRFYRMKPVQKEWESGWNEFYPWSSSPIMEPLGIRFQDLGVLATVGKNKFEGGEIAAVSLQRAKTVSTDTPYIFHFRTKYDLRRVNYRVERLKDSIIVIKGVLRHTLGDMPVPIKFDISSQDSGYFRLIIDCRYEGRRGGPQRTFKFYHKR